MIAEFQGQSWLLGVRDVTDLCFISKNVMEEVCVFLLTLNVKEEFGRGEMYCEVQPVG